MKPIAMLLAAAAGLACAAGPLAAAQLRPDAADSTSIHWRNWDSWRQNRLASLAKPDGWLSLVGLYWLNTGENAFGSDEKNPVRFPYKTPAKIGTLTLADGKVHVSIVPGVPVTAGGKPVTEMDLESDAKGEPTV